VVTLKSLAIAAIDDQSETLREISLYLKENPELSWEERLAAAKLTAYLEAQGFTVERAIGHTETAFRATRDSGRPGPAIAFLAEYDALPDVGHGCGHNLIAASAVGAAVGASAALDQVGGKVVVMGTPSEEFTNQPPGKIRLLEAGEFAGLDACLMLHPSTRATPYNSSLAFMSVEVTFHGQTAHAAADPWNGRNALDGVILTFNHVSALRQHVRPEIRIHGVIKDGGVVPNIIPERAVAHFILRAPTLAQVKELVERFKGCAEGAAEATGTTVEIDLTETVADTRPYPTLQALTRANHEALGVPFGPPFDSAGSTDFGDVSYVCPSDCFYIDVDAGDIPWHSREATAACSSEAGLQAMINGAKVLAMDAVDLLANPELLARARLEMPEQPADAE